ncbi:MFS transporter [Microbulbifer yueqingensis]|uniref:Predicted arabinose efflux permease, MFS family n=1 Tax=Microbulbifer yueqingensis TaxID=658219 RepID=A0A1G9D0B0_9GAMM|nr:MFS transporter [Microbulbifer yueqingensis]SDK57095.1 Predicted arabinose efflux permease, MFS family [Microbulbifer yueqingensis]
MSLLPPFMRERANLVFFALFAVAASGFGQTFFISVFGGALRAEFGLSNAWYGASYSAATLASAIALLACGSLADRWPLRRITALVVIMLALACLLMAGAQHPLMLLPAFFLLRFAGQGFMTHLGMTTAGRYFSGNRGKVIAVAALGFPLAEVLLPTGGAWLIETSGWRSAWLVASLVLVGLVLPGLLWLADTRSAEGSGEAATTGSGDDLTRAEVLREPGFYLLLPAALMTPMVVTAVLFHQGAIGEARGWSLGLLAAAFGGYAAGHLLMLFLAGSLVDRFGAQRSLPLALLPMLIGLLLLAWVERDWVPLAYLTLFGITQAGTGTAGGALWPERYGTRHLGAIRAVSQGAMVLSTAISPLLAGLLLDGGIGVHWLAGSMAAAVAGSALLALLARPMRRGGYEEGKEEA